MWTSNPSGSQFIMQISIIHLSRWSATYMTAQVAELNATAIWNNALGRLQCWINRISIPGREGECELARSNRDWTPGELCSLEIQKKMRRQNQPTFYTTTKRCKPNSDGHTVRKAIHAFEINRVPLTRENSTAKKKPRLISPWRRTMAWHRGIRLPADITKLNMNGDAKRCSEPSQFHFRRYKNRSRQNNKLESRRQPHKKAKPNTMSHEPWKLSPYFRKEELTENKLRK